MSPDTQAAVTRAAIEYGVAPDQLCQCDNCGHVEPWTHLNDIKHYFERVDQDSDEHPDGECTKCGCLSYSVMP